MLNSGVRFRFVRGRLQLSAFECTYLRGSAPKLTPQRWHAQAAMSVHVRNLQRILPVNRRLLKRQAECIRDAIENGKYRDHDATIILTSNARIRKLNRRYGGSRETTDVLTFRLADKPAFGDEVLDHESLMKALRNSPYLNTETGQLEHAPEIAADLGTMFMAVPYCDRLAVKNGLMLPDYLLLCCVHGMAHLVGHDHDTPERLARMRETERMGIESVVLAGLARDVPESYLK